MSEQDPVVMHPLVAQILTANAAHTAAVTNSVIDSLTAQRDTAEATLAAVRARVDALNDGPYAPSERAIRHALWPLPEEVDQYRTDKEF